MRTVRWALLALVEVGVFGALAATAHADARTKELAVGYEKELAACRTRADGVTRVVAGAQALIEGGQAQHADDLAALRAGLTTVEAYCAELAATLAILGAEPNPSYRALERKLDEQDNKIRKLRQQSKQVLEALAPVISRMIPAMNARVGAAAASAPRRVRVPFPAGRAIDAPALRGTYRAAGTEASDIVEYAEGKASATATTRLAAGETCEALRRSLPAEATAIAASEPARALGLTWYVSYARPVRRVRAACKLTKAGAVLGTLDEPTEVGGWPDLEPVLVAMIAARS